MTASATVINTDDDLIAKSNDNDDNWSDISKHNDEITTTKIDSTKDNSDNAEFNLNTHSLQQVSKSIPSIIRSKIAATIAVVAALRDITLRQIYAKYSMDKSSKCNKNTNKNQNKSKSIINNSLTTISTNQADCVIFAAAFAVSLSNACATATSFSLTSQDNNTFFNYSDGTAAFAAEKDAINRSFLLTTTTTNITTASSTDDVATTTAATTTNATAAAAEDWAHFYDLILSWQGICLIAVFCTFIVITIIGNTLVILAVITTRRLKTVTNCFVMSLAVADLLVGIFVMPPAVAVHLTGSWQLGWILCDIWISLDVLLCTASILSLCAISVDRYLAVTQPLNYSRKRRSKRLALIMILIVWVLALAITCPPMLGWYEPGRRDLKQCRYNQNKGYVIFSAMGSFFIPMAVMIYVYARISCVIASRHDNMTDISVHNKKFKRYTSADVDNDMDHYLSEQELNSAQKKQVAIRTFSNQTIVKELHEVMLPDSTENSGSKTTTHCNSLLALPTGNTKNSCYELTRPSSFRRSPTPSATMTSACGGTMGSTGMSSLGDSDNRMMEHHWPYGGNGTGSGSGSIISGMQARTHSMRHHAQQQQQHQQLHEHHLNPSTAGLLMVTPSQQHQQQQQSQQQNRENNITALTIPQVRQTRIYHHQQHQHQHHHSKSLSNRITSLKKENKTTQTLSIVVGGFIACWLPFFVYYLMTPFLDEQQVSSTLTKVLTWLGWFNSAINPFIYAFYSVDFRAAFWRLTCKRFFSSSSKPQFPSNTMSIRR